MFTALRDASARDADGGHPLRGSFVIRSQRCAHHRICWHRSGASPIDRGSANRPRTSSPSRCGLTLDSALYNDSRVRACLRLDRQPTGPRIEHCPTPLRPDGRRILRRYGLVSSGATDCTALTSPRLLRPRNPVPTVVPSAGPIQHFPLSRRCGGKPGILALAPRRPVPRHSPTSWLPRR